MQLLDIPKQIPSSEIDEDIIEIFFEEIGEIQTEIITNFKTWKDDQTNVESLNTLRRCFHTMKGSGRLVGATIIGELGWRFENLLNRVIDGTLSVNDDLLGLIGQVEKILPSLLEQFQHNQSAPYEVLLLISQADYFLKSKGQSLGDFDPPNGKTEEAPSVQAETLQESEKVQIEDTPLEPESLKDIPSPEPIPENDILETKDDIENAFETKSSQQKSEDTPLVQLESPKDIPSPEPIPENDILETEDDIENAFETNELTKDELKLGSEEDIFDSTLDTGFDGLEELNTESNGFDDLENVKLPEDFELETVDLPADLEIVSLSETEIESTEIESIESIEEPEAPPINDTIEIGETGEKTKITWAVKEDSKDEFEKTDSGEETKIIGAEEDSKDEFEKTDSGEETKIIGVEEDSTDEFEMPDEETKIIGYEEDSTDEFKELFFEEADEILENTQSLLERWTAAPKNMQLMKELQRDLHTLKGGARMVGIAPIGELSHHLESVLTQIVEGIAKTNPKLQEIIQNSVDELAAMLAAIRSNVPLDMPEDLIKQINAALDTEEEQELPPIKSPGIEEQKTARESSEPRRLEKLLEKEAEFADSVEDRIRVKATLIDKLTNLAGELSISRAHIEQQQGTLKNNLIEMEETVIRLRDQLRRFEIETEAQIISHFSDTRRAEGEEFDPLELDRFSVMQQLSRSLMESVSDLTSIQDSLKNVTRQSDSLLIQQSRIGAELQDGIMRTRMVPFTKISPRLQRIARLTARELHKKVDFIIKGEEIEFERTVLNRIVAPLEHMLRNAIDHGIEEAKTRQEAGKPSEAKITIALSREGAELIIKLSDDGAGLNLPKIRQKAEKRGLIKPETVINDQELMQFVLEHGFSTADKLTPTSGRGVGMDVAYSEIKQLGGSLRIHSKTNEGTTFDIRLPLSLTITQALLVHIGEETMAIPMNHVDAVMRVPRAEVIGKADEVHYYKYMDNNYRIFNLGELLGFSQMNSDEISVIPMLLAHVADRRVALLVDGIEGSKEIVVKSVGAQIGAIRWLAGATILGDGRVVLILDMPSITRVDITAVTVPPPITETVEEEKPVAKTIMIVDDSITVRKVTARFLKRQGMDVLTAKDGLDAIAQLQEHTPDLMLLDIEMPRMDGYELATQLRNRPDFKHLPIIMITSRTGAKHRDKAKKMGIDHYLGKPFNESELLENIHALLA